MLDMKVPGFQSGMSSAANFASYHFHLSGNCMRSCGTQICSGTAGLCSMQISSHAKSMIYLSASHCCELQLGSNISRNGQARTPHAIGSDPGFSTDSYSGCDNSQVDSKNVSPACRSWMLPSTPPLTVASSAACRSAATAAVLQVSRSTV